MILFFRKSEMNLKLRLHVLYNTELQCTLQRTNTNWSRLSEELWTTCSIELISICPCLRLLYQFLPERPLQGYSSTRCPIPFVLVPLQCTKPIECEEKFLLFIIFFQIQFLFIFILNYIKYIKYSIKYKYNILNYIKYIIIIE